MNPYKWLRADEVLQCNQMNSVLGMNTKTIFGIMNKVDPMLDQ